MKLKYPGILSFSLVAAAALAVLLALVFMAPPPGRAMLELTQTPSTTPSAFAHLPVTLHDPVPTPGPTPVDPPYSAAAALTITPYKGINASTYNSSSFIVANESQNGERLVELAIDLSTAIFQDMVFDPYGTAGDTVAKDLQIDVRVGLGFDGYEFMGEHDGGFDQIALRFRNFDRGDRFEFSIDVDPTSITGVGAPGPHETGSVGGLELVGATITATFDDGTVLQNQVWRMSDAGDGGASHSGAVAVLRPGLPERPSISILGVDAPAGVSSPNQQVRVVGPSGLPVVVLVVEGGLFTEGVPGGGFDIEPYEANTALVAREYAAVVGPGGFVDVPVSLSRTLDEGGINIISAALDTHYGVKGLVAGALTLQLEDE